MNLVPTTWTIYDPEFEGRAIVTVEHDPAQPHFDWPQRFVVKDKDSANLAVKRAFDHIDEAKMAARDLADLIVARREAEKPYIDASRAINQWAKAPDPAPSP